MTIHASPIEPYDDPEFGDCEPVDDNRYDGPEDEQDCPNCGGTGYSHHDCGEDTCCCLHPEDNVICDWCEGKG